MEKIDNVFNESAVLHDLKHYLPAQAPLKDFIHHNSLHAFQHLPFFNGIARASKIFGYKVTLSLEEYRSFYHDKKIKEQTLDRILQNKGPAAKEWKVKLLEKSYDMTCDPRVGALRAGWETYYHIDLDVLVQPFLFRIVCSYLDQGISIWNFPVLNRGLLNAIRELEKNSFASFFKSPRAKSLLNSRCRISDLLKIIVGDESLYEHYLFDQQFAHQGWSGMVSVIEDHPETLMDKKRISLKDFIIFELLLEIDALDQKFGEIWAPLAHVLKTKPEPVFADTPYTEYDEVLALWQQAYEWTYYDGVLKALGTITAPKEIPSKPSFQAIFCIDDREISFRDYLEKTDPVCKTYATPGFFGVEFFFQPEHGKAYTKQCPAPVTPKYLVKELETISGRKKDLHYTKHTHGLLQGLLIAPTLGFWSATKLFISIFRPSLGAAVASSFSHMDEMSKLTVKHDPSVQDENGLQVGFTISEMASRVKAMLTSIGLTGNFADIVYLVGHGATSANNPHYAAYNCGACSGRPGSVNARVFAKMANDTEVRERLKSEGFFIPDTTWFIGALHDTTRDEIQFFVSARTPGFIRPVHQKNISVFEKALALNSKERARRFELIDHKGSALKVHRKILRRSISLFETRPELNHATNALCIVGRRSLTSHLFLDRRAFANSYDYRIDPDGKILADIMRPLGPVCGGINLEYYFSKVDNQKLGAGTKLPHNVMGLFGVANGFDGDLRPGLPSQMIELHDPVRLMTIVEHEPDVVLNTIKSDDAMYEWYNNYWIHLVVIKPETHELFVFRNGNFEPYVPEGAETPLAKNIDELIEKSRENLPVYKTAI